MPLLMKMANITGESEIETGWINILSFEWSGERSQALQTGGSYGRSASFAAPQLSAIEVSREADAVSALLWKEMISGARAKLEFKWLRTGQGGGGPISYLEASFGGAKIAGITASASGGRPMEAIKFIYQTLEFRLINVGDALTGTQDVVSYDVPVHVMG